MHDTYASLVHDLGEHPVYDRTAVLLSTNFRYLGGAGTTSYERDFSALAPQWLHDLNRDYEVNHSPAVQDALRQLQEQLWKAYPDRVVIGRPTEAPGRGGVCGCEDDEDPGCLPQGPPPKGGCPPPRGGSRRRC
jgi:hypothetical protein